MGSVRGGADLRVAGAVGWTSHEVGPWPGAIVRWDLGDDAGLSTGAVGGTCDVDCPSNVTSVERRVRCNRGSDNIPAWLHAPGHPRAAR